MFGGSESRAFSFRPPPSCSLLLGRLSGPSQIVPELAAALRGAGGWRALADESVSVRPPVSGRRERALSSQLASHFGKPLGWKQRSRTGADGGDRSREATGLRGRGVKKKVRAGAAVRGGGGSEAGRGMRKEGALRLRSPRGEAESWRERGRSRSPRQATLCGPGAPV